MQSTTTTTTTTMTMTPPETTNGILPPLPVLDLARLETDDTIFDNDEDDDDDDVTGVVLPPPAGIAVGRSRIFRDGCRV